MKQSEQCARNSQAGFTLVETLVGALLFSILGIVLVQFIAINAALLTASAKQRDADAQATGGLNRIVALKPSDDARAFDWQDDKRVRLLAPVSGYYDFIVAPSLGADPPLPAGCSGWPCAVDPDQRPQGTDILFLRAWTVSTKDSLRNIHQVRVGIFPGSALRDVLSGSDVLPVHEGTEALAAREGYVTFR